MTIRRKDPIQVSAPPPTRKRADPNPNPTPVTPRQTTSAIPALPSWWGVLDSYGPSTITYGDVQFPLSGAIAPTTLLPVCYGAVRIGGTQINFGPTPGYETSEGGGFVVFCEGEIQSIDDVLVNGSPLHAPYTAEGGLVELSYTNYKGAAGDTGDGFTSVAYTKVFCYTGPTTGWIWWWLLSSSRDPSTPLEWAADVHGLKLYDPRKDSTSPGYDASFGVSSQRFTDPTTWQYSNNPVLEVRDVLKRWGKTPDADFNDALIGAGATASDNAGFSCNIAFATETTIESALGVILQTCNGTLVQASGLWSVSLDVPQLSPSVATFDESLGDVWGLAYNWLTARGRITRMAVSFLNSAANYVQDQTPNLDDPGIALGTTPVTAQVVNAPGINTLAAAIVLRNYLFNVQAVGLQVTGTMRGQAITLVEGQKITLKTLKGVVADYLVQAIAPDENGFFTFTAIPYDGAIYGGTPVSQPPPVTVPVLDQTPPPPPAAGRVHIGVPPAASIAFDLPRVYTGAGPYGASYWTVTGAASYTAANINDGVTTVIAITTTGGVVTYAVLDLTAGHTAAFGRFDFWTDTPMGAGTPLFLVEYSDDGSTWTSALLASGASTQPWQDAAVGGIYPQHVEIPTATGAHRWWRVSFWGSTAVNIYEVAASTFTAWSGTPSNYELRGWPGGGLTPTYITPDPRQTVVMPVATLPTDGSPFALPVNIPILRTTGDATLTTEVWVWSGSLTTRSTAGISSSTATPFFNTISVMPSAPTGTVPVSSPGSPGGITWISPNVEKLMIEVPAGVIDGTNKTFTLSQTPMGNRIACFVDGQQIVGNADFGRASRTVTISIGGNAPTKSALVIYSYMAPVGSPLPSIEAANLVGTATTWALDTMSAGGNWRSAAFANGLFVAVSVNSSLSYAIATSPDGINWTARYTGTSPGGSWGPVAYGNGTWVVMNGQDEFNVTTLTSPDGITWTQHSQSVFPANYGWGWHGLTYAGGQFVAVRNLTGGTTSAATSPDGITWTFRTTPDTNYDSVCYSPSLSLYMAVGASGGGYIYMMSSPDGVTWTRRTGTFSGTSGLSCPCVIWSPALALYVACGVFATGHEIATSPDGATWTAQATPTFGAYGPGAVVWSADRALLVAGSINSGGPLATSPNAITWTAIASPPAIGISALAAGDTVDAVVAVGTGSAVSFS